LVRVTLSGLCGTDLHSYHARLWQVDPAVIQGHEAVGVVHTVGEGVTRIQPGERVLVYQAFGCQQCLECALGNDHLCQVATNHHIGQKRHGGRADFIVVTERMCLRLPEWMSFEDAVVLSCAGGTAYAALRKVNTSYDDTVVVFGLGPVGLSAVMFAKAMGAKVIGVDPKHEQRKFASTFGADELLGTEPGDPAPLIKELLRGAAGAVAVECSGSSVVRTSTILQATPIRNTTRIVYVALGASEDRMPVRVGQRTVTGTHIFSLPDFYTICSLIAAKNLHPGEMVTHRFPLEKAAEAYQLLEQQPSGKIVFDAALE
jgi:D-arabinose 1-dehydrogenase-like Zn-dependent alcohol dehydrogenase